MPDAQSICIASHSKGLLASGQGDRVVRVFSDMRGERWQSNVFRIGGELQSLP